jgi:PAS domain S-box-containing protein
MNAATEITHRILVVDDSRAIHDDFRKIFAGCTRRPVDDDEAVLFGTPDDTPGTLDLQIDSAHQGEEALTLVQQACAEGRPYAMAFMDVRMPPGWDGIETTARIWAVDPDLQIVICTAYSDYSRDAMIRQLGRSDKLLILKKPFDNVEALQLAAALTEKWQLTQQARRHVRELEDTVARRTAQLRQSEDRYRLITENAADLIALVADDGQLLYRSPSFQHLLGYSAAELAATAVFDLIHPDDRPLATAALHDCTTLGLKRSSVFRVRHHDGTWRTMEAHTSPFRDSAGSGALFVVRDITERHKLELQLRQAQKLESIGQLAAGIAHEINTPLQFIGDNTVFLGQTFADLTPLLQACGALLAAAPPGSIPSAQLDDLRTAYRAASADYLLTEIPKAIHDTMDGVHRTTKIVQAMKTFSHPGSADRVPVNLREAIESTLTISRSEWRHVAEVVTDFDPDLPAVPLFAAEFNQALLNLIVNATHAIADVVGPDPAAKGTITLSTRRQGGCAEVRVRDTGTGIAAAIQPRIFDPFFTTKPPGKGTGQGLAIVHSVIVDKHGGALQFETAVGRGTEFIICLPLHAAQTLPPGENPPPARTDAALTQ